MSIRHRHKRLLEQQKLAEAVAETDQLAYDVLQQVMPFAIELDPTTGTGVWKAVDIAHQWLYPKHPRRTLERFHLCGFVTDVMHALNATSKRTDNTLLANQCRSLADIASRMYDTTRQLSTTVCHHNRP